MRVGMCGFPKSGNYLLWRILKAIILQLGSWSSYNNYSHCWAGLFQPEDLAFPEEEEVDQLYTEGETVILYTAGHRIRLEPGSWDLGLFNEKAKLIWTHQKPRIEYFELFGQDRKWIYILRDGRAVVNSLMHFEVTPVQLKRYPDYKITEVSKLYQLPGRVEKKTKGWKEHIDAFQRMRDRYLLVRFEDLTAHKAEQVSRIINYLGISDWVDIDAIDMETSFGSMKKDAPVHVRKGESRDWANYFGKEHIRTFKEIGGDTLIALGYEKDKNW